MSLELKDFRTKLPVETMAVIKGYAAAFGKDESEIARDVLNEWAEKISHATRIAHKYLEVEGVSGRSRE
jgi:hypothetical protein